MRLPMPFVVGVTASPAGVPRSIPRTTTAAVWGPPVAGLLACLIAILIASVVRPTVTIRMDADVRARSRRFTGVGRGRRAPVAPATGVCAAASDDGAPGGRIRAGPGNHGGPPACADRVGVRIRRRLRRGGGMDARPGHGCVR